MSDVAPGGRVGPLAEATARCLQKGSAVYVEGVLRTRAYQGTNGEQRRGTEIKAARIQFLDPRPDASQV